ncbi:MAG: DpnD/PcfM family protein [Clostridiales bacterium]|nr:DpnD/PcfM family protein [Clostridiales bacterium]
MEERKEFVVYITETLQRKVIVKAVDKIDAENQVINQYNNEEIVLNETDYLSVEFDTKEK